MSLDVLKSTVIQQSAHKHVMQAKQPCKYQSIIQYSKLIKVTGTDHTTLLYRSLVRQRLSVLLTDL